MWPCLPGRRRTSPEPRPSLRSVRWGGAPSEREMFMIGLAPRIAPRPPPARQIMKNFAQSIRHKCFRVLNVSRAVNSGKETICTQTLRNANGNFFASVNGEVPQRVSTRQLEQAVVTAADPCGGCVGPGGPGDRSKKGGTMCNEGLNLSCALGLAGCAGCVATCGTSGWACTFCLVTSCGGTIASGGCCKGDGSSHHVCEGCVAPL